MTAHTQVSEIDHKKKSLTRRLLFFIIISSNQPKNLNDFHSHSFNIFYKKKNKNYKSLYIQKDVQKGNLKKNLRNLNPAAQLKPFSINNIQIYCK